MADDRKVNPEELSPEERAVAAEGQALEREVRKLIGEEKSPILGPDGRALDKEQPKPGGVIATDADKQEQEKRAFEAARRKVEEDAEKIEEILTKYPAARAASSAILSAYRLLRFAISDLGTFEGFNVERLDHLSRYMRKLSAERGINVMDLRHELLGGRRKRKEGGTEVSGVIPYLDDRIQCYAAESRRRKAAIADVQRRIGNKGIALPCHSLQSLYKEPPFFAAGRLFVLHGEEKAVRMALRHCAFTHQEKNGSKPFYLSADRDKQTWDAAFTVMPLVWWRDAASSNYKMTETLRPVVTSRSLLLVMEGLTHLWTPEKPPKNDWERRARALGTLYQWASENQVAVIVGDFVEGPVEERTYGNLPHVACTIAKISEGDEEERLFVGSDPLPLITEEV